MIHIKIPETTFTRALTFGQSAEGGTFYVTEKRPSVSNPGTEYDHVCFVLVWVMPWTPATLTVLGARRLVKFRAKDA